MVRASPYLVTSVLLVGRNGAFLGGADLQDRALLRTAHAHLRVLAQTSGASMKSQFKHADQSGAQWACVLGESECQQQTVTLKHLRDRSIAQRTLAWSELINFFKGDEA